MVDVVSRGVKDGGLASGRPMVEFGDCDILDLHRVRWTCRFNTPSLLLRLLNGIIVHDGAFGKLRLEDRRRVS
jgi:hypothetical protein